MASALDDGQGQQRNLGGIAELSGFLCFGEERPGRSRPLPPFAAEVGSLSCRVKAGRHRAVFSPGAASGMDRRLFSAGRS